MFLVDPNSRIALLVRFVCVAIGRLLAPGRVERNVPLLTYQICVECPLRSVVVVVVLLVLVVVVGEEPPMQLVSSSILADSNTCEANALE